MVRSMRGRRRLDHGVRSVVVIGVGAVIIGIVRVIIRIVIVSPPIGPWAKVDSHAWPSKTDAKPRRGGRIKTHYNQYRKDNTQHDAITHSVHHLRPNVTGMI